jgi:2-amino-4-hydroxy-6-hydroxymethyldihydropteridine diphosphokinase
MATCLIGLGSNLGDRAAILEVAASRLSQNPQIRVARRSGWIETTPAGGSEGQPPYLNGALALETSLEPLAILKGLQRIEAELGRRRDERWGPRTVDLDLLLYDDLVIETPTLTLPHPRMAWRRFVLEPAAQVAPAMVHPATGWTIGRLLEHLNSTPWYVAIAGSIGAGKTQLAREVTGRIAGARLLAEQLDLPRLAKFYDRPASQAWRMELEFLESRAASLAAGLPRWSDHTRPTVSDFWFDQSAAFAQVWLPEDQWPSYQARFQQVARGVVRPRLVVLLEAPEEELLQRVHSRGRACEQSLSGSQLQRIADSIREQAAQPGQGPVLRINNGERSEALVEVLAAIEAMK